MTDEEKEERRTLISNNKAMESATVVRLEWVKTLLGRKTAPKGWQYFTIRSLTQHYDIGRSYDEATAAHMIGATVEDGKGCGYVAFKSHVAASPARPEFSLLALVFARFEEHIQKDSWRDPGEATREYLAQLVSWGYVPSDVEQIITQGAVSKVE